MELHQLPIDIRNKIISLLDYNTGKQIKGLQFVEDYTYYNINALYSASSTFNQDISFPQQNITSLDKFICGKLTLTWSIHQQKNIVLASPLNTGNELINLYLNLYQDSLNYLTTYTAIPNNNTNINNVYQIGTNFVFDGFTDTETGACAYSLMPLQRTIEFDITRSNQNSSALKLGQIDSFIAPSTDILNLINGEYISIRFNVKFQGYSFTIQ